MLFKEATKTNDLCYLLQKVIDKLNTIYLRDKFFS